MLVIREYLSAGRSVRILLPIAVDASFPATPAAAGPLASPFDPARAARANPSVEAAPESPALQPPAGVIPRFA
jgi:hypothetical protein